MSVDTIGNFLTIIRNGVGVSKRFVVAPYSHIKKEIADILKSEGYIKDYAIVGEGKDQSIKVMLKYVDGESVIHDITRVSTPGRRIYRGYKNADRVIGGLGIAILTTSHGLMTDKRARESAVGGEVLCTVW